MASLFPCKALIVFAILTVSLSTSSATLSSNRSQVYPNCPNLFDIVRNAIKNATNIEPRMGASLLRLHFHDCFVKGCDASILLDSTDPSKTEKSAGPNINSVRGFEVIDKIKKDLEKECPKMVSCADILAIAARDSVHILSEGNNLCYPVELGRLDAKTTSKAAVGTHIPSPNSNITQLIDNFANHTLNITDLVALSGAHTIGLAKCSVIRPTLYNKSEQLNQTFAAELKKKCPNESGKTDNITFPLDLETPIVFDNSYFNDVQDRNYLLHSDGQLLGKETKKLVVKYSEDKGRFFRDFANAMIKMGRIGVLENGANEGEIRTNCRKRN